MILLSDLFNEYLFAPLCTEVHWQVIDHRNRPEEDFRAQIECDHAVEAEVRIRAGVITLEEKTLKSVSFGDKNMEMSRFTKVQNPASSYIVKPGKCFLIGFVKSGALCTYVSALCRLTINQQNCFESLKPYKVSQNSMTQNIESSPFASAVDSFSGTLNSCCRMPESSVILNRA